MPKSKDEFEFSPGERKPDCQFYGGCLTVNSDFDTRGFSCDECRHYIQDEEEWRRNVWSYLRAAWAVISGENPYSSRFRVERPKNLKNGTDSHALNERRYRARKKLRKELSHAQKDI